MMEPKKAKGLWIRSLILAMFSLACIVAIALKPLPQPPGYAPYAFAYNISFFFPVLLLSLLSALISLVYIIRTFLNWKALELRWKGFLATIPILMIAPTIFQVGSVVLHILLLLTDPSMQSPD